MVKGLYFLIGKPNEISLKSCCECIKEGLKTFFVPEDAKFETVVQSEPGASCSKVRNTSMSNNSKPKAMTNSDSKTSKINILKRSKPVPQSLLKLESAILKSKFQKNKTVVASCESKCAKPKVLVNQKLSNSQYKVQEVKSKTSDTNLKGPIKQRVPKSEIVNTANMSKSKGKAKIMVPRQRLLKTYDRREVYVPHLHNERRRKCEVWRQPIWQDHWYRNYW